MDIIAVCAELREGARELALHTAEQKNQALQQAASVIKKNTPAILDANRRDIDKAQKNNVPAPLIDRLSLNESRIANLLSGLQIIIGLPDPTGEILAGWQHPKGLQIRQVRTPIGVAAIIYESRPAVTVDAFALAYKSGNALLLRGSASALESNKALFAAIKAGLEAAGKDGVPRAATLADSGKHSEVDAILNARGLIDVVLPRGGAGLIRMVTENAKVPVIETGSGVCHLFADESADVEMAAAITENGKLQRPGVCNALETLVTHRNIAEKLLPRLAERFAGQAELRCDPEAYAILKGQNRVVPAAEPDFGFEFLDNILAIKTVSGIDEAIAFINTHNTKHSETIITRNMENAEKFRREIDAACVYVNASTRFTDGGEFGFGAELGISTQKLHIRGPMGLRALTTTKYLIDGTGQIRE